MKIILYKKKMYNSTDYCFKVDEERSRIMPNLVKQPLEKLAFMLSYFYKQNISKIELKNTTYKDSGIPLNKKEYVTFMKYLNKENK
jgi:hypothetical protein